MASIYEAQVARVERGGVRLVARFLVVGDDGDDATVQAGMEILRSKHNCRSDYHEFAVNLTRGVGYYHDYTLLLEKKGRARPGVFVS